MNQKSAAKCGISVSILLSIIHYILGILTFLLNKVFVQSYPKACAPFIFCLPKKGKLNVRGISIKPLLAKLYDLVVKNGLQQWLKLPKGKSCILHVFFKPLFIGVTDFEAAFDYISRINLLVNLGIGRFMLHALIEMYKVIETFVFLDGEYSHRLSLTAGVLQGSSSSTVLFMAYTSDINIFRVHFPAEELIHYFHIL